jgi:acyl carrier protein
VARSVSATAHEIEEEVVAFLRTLHPDAAPTRDEPLLESGAIDSMGLVELIEHLDGRFRIAIADREVTDQNFGTVARIVGLVQAKLAAA